MPNLPSRSGDALDQLRQNAEDRVTFDLGKRLRLQGELEDLVVRAWRAGHEADEIAKAGDLAMPTVRRILAEQQA